MKLDITQKELSVVRDNEIDSLGNKIKLKFSSLANLVKNRVNVVYNVTGVAEVDAPIVVEQDNNTYSLLSGDFVQLASGGERPINVKERMLNNMRTKGRVISIVPFSTEPQVENDNNNENNNIEVENAISVDEAVVAHTEPVSLNEDPDIDKMFEKVTAAREGLLNIREKVQMAEDEANQSEQMVQDLGVQFTETEKTLQAAVAKREQVKRQIYSELQSQLATMDNEQRQYDMAIANANQRREESQNKIIDFESRINDNIQKISDVNDDIAREEEKYHTLVGMSPISMTNEEEQYVRKAA